MAKTTKTDKDEKRTWLEKRQAGRIRKLERTVQNLSDTNTRVFEQLYKHQKDQPPALTAAQQARLELLKLQWDNLQYKSYTYSDASRDYGVLRYSNSLVHWVLTGDIVDPIRNAGK